MFSRSRIVVAAMAFMIVLANCGSAEPEQETIRLEANAVGGGQLYYGDLASQDTVLWFWAPW